MRLPDNFIRKQVVKMTGGASARQLFVFPILMLLFMLTQWSSTVYLPIIPKVTVLFNNASLMTSSLSLFFLGYAVGQLFWGVLSDYLGRYLALSLAMLIYLVFEVLIVTADNAVVFVSFLALTGFAISANTSVGNALVRDLYSKSRAQVIIGYLGIGMACGPVIAPLLGSSLYMWWGWRANFAFLAIMGLLLLIAFVVIFRVGASAMKLQQSATATPLVMLRETLADHAFVSYVIVLSVTFGIFFSILLIVPFVLIQIAGFSVKKVGYLLFVINLFCVAGTVLNAFLNQRVRQRSIVAVALFLVFAGLSSLLVCAVLLKHPVSIVNFLATAMTVFGAGILIPAAKAGAMTTRDCYIGTAASVMKFLQSLGNVLLTSITALCIHNAKTASLLLLLWVAALFSILMVIFLRKHCQ